MGIVASPPMSKLDVALPGSGKPSTVVTRLARCVPEAIAEVAVATSHLHLVSGTHGKQAAFEVEIAAAIHKWLTYILDDKEFIVRELPTVENSKKKGGGSIDLAILRPGGSTPKGKPRDDEAVALVELKVVHDEPEIYKYRSGNFKKGDAKPIPLGNDAAILAKAVEPPGAGWKRKQATSIVAIAVCFCAADITESARSTARKSPDLRLAGTQSFSVFSRSKAEGLQPVQVAYFVVPGKDRMKSKKP